MALRQSLTIDMRSLRGSPRRLTSRRLSPRRQILLVALLQIRARPAGALESVVGPSDDLILARDGHNWPTANM
jgi:hypothetical protein